ncbi:hypothetical protein Aple_075640 [Acrocarpospora pleiomorpha]|uniref:Uncharacterized protein n=1 Tax=Acrocarpospora pleiomorpha TaxID=90975 RepID=A0A5M3XTT2_9ACTN|nr:hypothetical protein Aple_075640 [Acrocarpospora pleiomorpha]
MDQLIRTVPDSRRGWNQGGASDPSDASGTHQLQLSSHMTQRLAITDSEGFLHPSHDRFDPFPVPWGGSPSKQITKDGQGLFNGLLRGD